MHVQLTTHIFHYEILGNISLGKSNTQLKYSSRTV